MILQDLHRFRVYASRAVYREEHGYDPPPYNPAKLQKPWYDPHPTVTIGEDGVVYQVLAQREGWPRVDESGRPFLTTMVMTKEDAATVNLRPVVGVDLPQTSNEVQGYRTDLTVPVPLSNLPSGYRFELGFGGLVRIVPDVPDVPVESTEPGTGGGQFPEEAMTILRKLDARMDLVMALLGKTK